MSIHDLTANEIRWQAEQGDLLPQANPHAVVTWDPAALNGSLGIDELQSILLNRFFELSRPIADAFREPGLDMRLGDAGRFFYLLEALQRLGYSRIEETLLVFLDEFSQLEQHSYDQLYLWSIVELSRRKPEYVETFWPLALTLDLRFRAVSWKRPAGWSLADQPYRMIECVMYFYALYTLQRAPYYGSPRYPSLAACLLRFFRQLDQGQEALLLDSLSELARQERRPAFGDAYGVLLKVKKEGTMARGARTPEP